MTELISKAQMVRLQTLYAAYVRREMGVTGNTRAARLQWATQSCGRAITTYGELTRSEANSMIDCLQTALGQAFEPADRAKGRARNGVRGGRQIMSRDAAQAAGTEGRRDGPKTITLVSGDDLDLVRAQMTELGWDPARLEAWLRSPSSPLRPRTAIRTQGDANRVLWALRGMTRRARKTSHNSPSDEAAKQEAQPAPDEVARG